jgi:hypothetical protein
MLRGLPPGLLAAARQERAPATHLKRLMAEKGENTLFVKDER